MIDLQCHSTVSDGQLPPAEVVEHAVAAGVEVLALTDHDSVAGVSEAQDAADRAGIELIPAVEISSVHPFADDLHICGYWMDLQMIASVCERAQRERVERAEEIVANLQREGFRVTLDDAVAEAGDARSIGRPHIAVAAGAAHDMKAFFEEYLVPGGKAFVPRRWPTAAEAVEMIDAAYGCAVIAHPYWDIKDAAKVETLIRSLPFDGIETFYPAHTRSQTEHLLNLSRELGMTPTAASDFHGPTHKTFSRFGAYQTFGLGEPRIPPQP